MNLLVAGIAVIGIGYLLMSGPSIQPYAGPLRLVPWGGANPLRITHTYADGANTLFITNTPGPWDDKAYTRILSTDGTSCYYAGDPSQFNINDYRVKSYSQMGIAYYKLI